MSSRFWNGVMVATKAYCAFLAVSCSFIGILVLYSHVLDELPIWHATMVFVLVMLGFSNMVAAWWESGWHTWPFDTATPEDGDEA